MSQNQTPASPATQPTETVDDATRAAATKELMAELHRKTQQVIQDNPEVLKGVPGGITGVTPK